MNDDKRGSSAQREQRRQYCKKGNIAQPHAANFCSAFPRAAINYLGFKSSHLRFSSFVSAMSSSRPESATSMNPSDFATAPNTPSPATPLPEPTPVPTPQQSNTHLPDNNEVQNTPEASQSSPRSNTSTSSRDVHTPLPVVTDEALQPPRASYLAPISDASTVRNSFGPSSFNDSSQGLADEKVAEPYADERAPSEKRGSIFKRPLVWLGAIVALIVLVLVIVLPVVLTKKHSQNTSATTGGSGPQSGGPSGPTSASAITGGDGSTITTETGVNFTYSNPFGGICRYPRNNRVCSINANLVD